MAKQIKFTIGNVAGGYKSVEIGIAGGKVSYQILRGGLLDVSKKIAHAVKVPDTWLAELEDLDIFSWEENYSSERRGGLQWELTFKSGKKSYRGRGNNAYPENFARFLDWLDVLVPELEFVDRRRLERLTLEYSDESMIIDRQDKTLTIDKKISAHSYDMGDSTKKIFDACQKLFDDIENRDVDSNSSSRVVFEIVRHDGSMETFETLYNENFLPGLTKFLNEVQTLVNDLQAEIFKPSPMEIVPQRTGGKYILCKVQFQGSYKHYTYSTDDETLATGDIVDVPVGRYNEIRQARIVEIGYFDEYDLPLPLDRIKKLIGKHVSNEWENY